MIDRTQKRARQLSNLFADFLEFYNLGSKDLTMDIIVLTEVCNRYYRDVDRLHQFHGIKNTDACKIAGYTTYWLTKLKPITVSNNQIYHANSKFGIYVNELFAIYASTGRMVADLSDKNLTLGLGFLGTFLYTLRYRATSGDNLSIMYQLLRQQNKCS